MKLNKNIQTLLLLVLISFNIMISNCEQIKNGRSRKIRSSYKRSQINRSYSNAKAKNFVLDTLKDIFTDPKNILYFSFGVASEFSSKAEPIYKKVKTIIDTFEPCFDVMKAAYSKINEKKQSKELAELRKSDSIIILEETLAKKENQKEYCEKIKEEIKENYRKMKIESDSNDKSGVGRLVNRLKPNFIREFDIELSRHLLSNNIICAEPTRNRMAPKTAQELRTKYNSHEEYYKQCMYFNNLDCEVFTPETNKVWSFIKNAYAYYGLVQTTGECINNLVSGPNADKKFLNIPGIGDLFKNGGLFYDALASSIGVLANIFTFGAWGGIKGGYYLIQLALDIKQFYDDITEDLAFRAGKLVGKGIVIAKSFLGARRKLYRRMK